MGEENYLGEKSPQSAVIAAANRNNDDETSAGDHFQPGGGSTHDLLLHLHHSNQASFIMSGEMLKS